MKRYIVQGVINKKVQYVGENNLEYEQEKELPFCTLVLVGARPGMQVDVIPSIHLLEPSISERWQVLSQKYIGDIFVKVTENIQFNLCEVETYKQ